MRAVVNLALDALACKDGAPGGYPKRNQLMAAAMRLRYGLDDNKPRTLKEVSAWSMCTFGMAGCLRRPVPEALQTPVSALRGFGPSSGIRGAL